MIFYLMQHCRRSDIFYEKYVATYSFKSLLLNIRLSKTGIDSHLLEKIQLHPLVHVKPLYKILKIFTIEHFPNIENILPTIPNQIR